MLKTARIQFSHIITQTSVHPWYIIMPRDPVIQMPVTELNDLSNVNIGVYQIIITCYLTLIEWALVTKVI